MMSVKSKKQAKLNKVLSNKTISDGQSCKVNKKKTKKKRKVNVKSISKISNKFISGVSNSKLQTIGEGKTSKIKACREKFARKKLKEEKWKFTKMREALHDPRFSHILTDPRYKSAPKDDVKIKLDSRFQSVLKNQDFFTSHTLDPRGKPKNYATKETLDKFYHLDSDDGHETDSESGTEDLEKTVEKFGDGNGGKLKRNLKVDEHNSEKEKEGENTEETFLKFLLDPEKDIARGEEFFSDDSSDDDSSTSEDNDEEVHFGEFDWGEFDNDAQWDCDGIEVLETNRFAVCDMDWDRVKAVDLMVLFSSFCPPSGAVSKVTIYPSEFGKKRMKEEDSKGPQELLQLSKSRRVLGAGDELEDLKKITKGIYSDSTAISSVQIEALRRYQRNRLRYYYAVVECDSIDTAKVIYQECDRTHFDMVGVALDLRYIPFDMDFNEVPYDECLKIPANYVSEKFSALSLQDAKPTLTWDETDQRRQRALAGAMSKALRKERIDDAIIKDYIGDSDESESNPDIDQEFSDASNEDDVENKEDRIAKFRSLISEIDEKEKKRSEALWSMNEEFEAAFSSRSRTNTDGDDYEDDDLSIVHSGDDDNDGDRNGIRNSENVKLTPFETFLAKKKEKRKKGKKLKNKSNQKNVENVIDSDSFDNESRESDSNFKEDKIPLSKTGPNSQRSSNSKKLGRNKKRKKIKKDSSLFNNKESKTNQEGLSLLIMDEEKEDKKHFDMRKISEMKKRREKKMNKKREKMDSQELKDSVGEFEVDWNDPRFSALFTSGSFHLDPSHPKFDRSSSTLPSCFEPQSLRKKKEEDQSKSEILKTYQQIPCDDGVCSLVEKIRRKTSKYVI